MSTTEHLTDKEALDRIAVQLHGGNPFPSELGFARTREIVRSTGRVCVDPATPPDSDDGTTSGYG